MTQVKRRKRLEDETLLILQPFRRFTYVQLIFSVSNHSVASLRHSSLSNPSIASLRHNTFFNPSVTSSTSQALHLRHLTSRPCSICEIASNSLMVWYIFILVFRCTQLDFMIPISAKYALFAAVIRLYTPVNSSLWLVILPRLLTFSTSSRAFNVILFYILVIFLSLVWDIHFIFFTLT